MPERVFAVFCRVETFLSQVCVSEIIVCMTMLIVADVLHSSQIL